MIDAFISGLSFALPTRQLSNEQLQLENPDWDMGRIEAKVGIRSRYVVSGDECASDLAFRAATRLLDGLGTDRSRIDALLLCTQSPDYFLPTTACILQDRLGLPTTCAALDYNQGCSGYVYGLFMAKSMIASGMARNVLLVTAETYSKFIHPRDRSVRVLFGDAATATLVNDCATGTRIGEITLGTDGSGYRNLIVPAGGTRTPCGFETRVELTDENGSVRSAEHLFMDGQELFLFTLKRVPEVVRATLEKAGITNDDVSWFVFHQANAYMNEHLRTKLKIPRERTPLILEQYGNTVSNTIPLTLSLVGEKFSPGEKVMLVGFGVGYSWGAALLDWNRVAVV
jgi:3-oxoacyl-[acyl-carrier-protein] synthase III